MFAVSVVVLCDVTCLVALSGWQINHLDLAPRYASVLVGITTTVGTVAGIVNPIIVGWMTTNQVRTSVRTLKLHVLSAMTYLWCYVRVWDQERWSLDQTVEKLFLDFSRMAQRVRHHSSCSSLHSLLLSSLWFR